MDVSALPYLYCLIVDCVLTLVFGFVQWQQKRAVLHFFLAFLFINGVRCLIIILSAGEHCALERDNFIWIIRGLVVLEHSVLIGMTLPFLRENTTLFGRRAS